MTGPHIPDGWRADPPGITATFATGSFTRGVELINRIAELAEAANHHPDIELSYPQVTVRLVTHDVGNTVTELDMTLAAQITEAAADLDIAS